MIIAIPSKGRPGRVKSQKVLTSATVFVPANEAPDYEKAGTKNVVAVPNEVKGITRTRNWILDNANDDWVVFIDDDLVICGYIFLDKFNGRHKTLTERQWIEEFVKLFEVTAGMGYRIFGVATDGALRSVYPYKPFIWHTYVTASCMGILNNTGIRFDETYPVKEDYEICLRCIKEDGGIVGARYIYWRNSHWSDPGGCKDYRTQSMERIAIQRLIKQYPGLIRRVTRGGSQYSIELDF